MQIEEYDNLAVRHPMLPLWYLYQEDGCCSTCIYADRMDWENSRFYEVGDFRCSLAVDLKRKKWNKTCPKYKKGVSNFNPELLRKEYCDHSLSPVTDAIYNAEISEENMLTYYRDYEQYLIDEGLTAELNDFYRKRDNGELLYDYLYRKECDEKMG